MGAMLGVNVLIGAATGGIGNVVAGRSFLSGAAKGASGGIFMFAGKKFISQKGSVAAWGGRQLAAVGTSQIRNAAAGRPLLGELVFPLGLTRVYVKTADRLRVSVRLDLSAVVSTAIMANRTELHSTSMKASRMAR